VEGANAGCEGGLQEIVGIEQAFGLAEIAAEVGCQRLYIYEKGLVVLERRGRASLSKKSGVVATGGSYCCDLSIDSHLCVGYCSGWICKYIS